MAEGRRRDAWGHTSSLLALLANCHRGPKSEAFKPADFDPYARRSETEAIPVALRDLRQVFVPG